MDVVVTTEQRFDRTPDGAVWTRHISGAEQFTQYLGEFSRCLVLARVRDLPEPGATASRADGPSVSFVAVPHYIGPGDYLRRVRSVQRAASGAAARECALIMELPSMIAWHVGRARSRHGAPFGAWVVGDPFDVFSPGGVDHPLRPLLRLLFAAQQRHLCRKASAAMYVTGEALQRRYPASPDAFTTISSNVELDSGSMASSPRRFSDSRSSATIVTVASLETNYKRVDILIEALAMVRARGIDVTLTVAGDGRERESLARHVSRNGVGDHVRFLGWVSPAARLREVLDAADVFVLASVQEGLPRAMVEAMARALPCIGTRVGGIPELLEDEELVPASDARALAEKLEEVLRSPARLESMSARNLRKAAAFLPASLGPQRRDFYAHVKSATVRWLARK